MTGPPNPPGPPSTPPGLAKKIQAFIKEAGPRIEVRQKPGESEEAVLERFQTNMLKQEAGVQATRRALEVFARGADFFPDKDTTVIEARDGDKQFRLTYRDFHRARRALETQRFAYASGYITALKSLFAGATRVTVDDKLDPYAAVRTDTTYRVGSGLMKVLQESLPEVLP